MTVQWSWVLISDESSIRQFIARKSYVRRSIVNVLRRDTFSIVCSNSALCQRIGPNMNSWIILLTNWSDHGWSKICWFPERQVEAAHKRTRLYNMYEEWRTLPKIQDCQPISRRRFKYSTGPTTARISTLWTIYGGLLKNKVANKHPGSVRDLDEAIKNVWIHELRKYVKTMWII